MPKILMLRTTRGSDSGMIVNSYEAKNEYTVGDKLANVFVNTLKVAELLPMEGAMREERDAKGARENKDAAPDKKSDKDEEKKPSRRS